MNRFAFTFALILTICGCNPVRDPPTAPNRNQAQQDDSARGATEHEWASFATNEWYQLSELRITAKQSIVHWKITKPDPQLGIAVAVDLAVLAKPRGFTHFRVKQSDPYETHARFLNDLEIDEELINEIVVVDFYRGEPDQLDRVFDVEMMVTLAKQQDSENSIDPPLMLDNNAMN